MRLIDADKLETHEQLEPLGNGKYEYVEVVYKDDIDDAHTIELQKWTPCSERLPEEDGLYLVTTSKGQVQVHVFNHNGNSKEYWMRCNKAWMPMPEPWKGETK